MSIQNTVIVIVPTDDEYRVPGDWTPEMVVNAYRAQLPGLASMVSTSSVSGDTKTITFNQRTGTKGAVTDTNIVIVSTDDTYNVPGDWTPEMVVNAYRDQIPGLASMSSDVSVSGSVKTITFRPRTGTKG
ncbi:MAG TPA: hypothetical protein VFM18_08645 [Methanosarcina sp.]|nr:hypothetical protein [Methanosarcina sp.]